MHSTPPRGPRRRRSRGCRPGWMQELDVSGWWRRRTGRACDRGQPLLPKRAQRVHESRGGHDCRRRHRHLDVERERHTTQRGIRRDTQLHQPNRNLQHQRIYVQGQVHRGRDVRLRLLGAPNDHDRQDRRAVTSSGPHTSLARRTGLRIRLLEPLAISLRFAASTSIGPRGRVTQAVCWRSLNARRLRAFRSA
jgi:hypothetical protein